MSEVVFGMELEKRQQISVESCRIWMASSNKVNKAFPWVLLTKERQKALAVGIYNGDTTILYEGEPVMFRYVEFACEQVKFAQCSFPRDFFSRDGFATIALSLSGVQKRHSLWHRVFTANMLEQSTDYVTTRDLSPRELFDLVHGWYQSSVE